MSVTQFSNAELLKVQAKAEELWSDPITNIDYLANCESFKAIKKEETASFTPLKDPGKDNLIGINWIKPAGMSVQEYRGHCEAGGVTPDTGYKEYEINLHKEVPFTIPEKVFKRTNNTISKETVLAKAFAEAKKVMDEYLAQQVVSQIDANAGVNQYPTPFSISGTDTVVPAANWTPDLMGHFTLMAVMNKFSNPFLLDGTNLWTQGWRAMMEQPNADGKGAANKMQVIRTYNDPFNVVSVLSPDKKTFMIQRGAVAVVTKNFYSSTPMVDAMLGQTLYSVPSENLPGVTYDVVYKKRCEGTDYATEEYYHDFKIVMHGLVAFHPATQSGDTTGILSFKCS